MLAFIVLVWCSSRWRSSWVVLAFIVRVWRSSCRRGVRRVGAVWCSSRWYSSQVVLAFVVLCTGIHCVGVAYVMQAWHSSWVWYSSVWVALVCWCLSCFTFIVQVWVWHTSCRCGVHCAGIRRRSCWRLSCRCGVRVRCSSCGSGICCADVAFVVLVFIMGGAGVHCAGVVFVHAGVCRVLCWCGVHRASIRRGSCWHLLSCWWCSLHWHSSSWCCHPLLALLWLISLLVQL